MILIKTAVLAFLAFYGYSMGQERGGLNTFGEMASLSFFIFGPWLYLLPVLEAAKRKHEKVTSIALVNILLGWTLIGWVFAMAWATGKPTADSTKACPFCGEDVKVEAIKCKHCGSDLQVQ